MTDEEKKYNDHSKFLADIAFAILNNNVDVLNINGVKEIIALYLLIPYITHDTLTTPGTNYIIPKLDLNRNFGGINDNGMSATLDNLRNALAHSFVTVEEFTNDGSKHGTYLIFDDRVIHERNDHDALLIKSKTVNIDIMQVHCELLKLFEEIRKM